MKIKSFIALIFLTSLTICCKDDVLPKPASQLRLDYPGATYKAFETPCPFTFEMNKMANVETDKDCGYSLHYKKMKATVYLTYKPVQNNIDKLLRDAQKLTYEHVIKADDILEQPFINDNDKVYGMFYRVSGNAATNAQFYVTDSVKHFVTGSVYFYAKPNYDSIMPATDYIKKDMRKIMETFRWK